jgi:DMSO/TMAO reductase YedYZ molybdopterin-dependent catalytic subunit
MMNESMMSSLPIHGMPNVPDPREWLLVLSDGRTEVRLDRAEISALPHADLVDSFACVEGWTTSPLTWRGVRLAELFHLLPGIGSGPYLAVSAPDACAVISVSDLSADSMLADTLNGAPLPREHGAPYRLVIPGGVCFESVKWVQRIERCDTNEHNSARSRAIRRLEARGSGGQPQR